MLLNGCENGVAPAERCDIRLQLVPSQEGASAATLEIDATPMEGFDQKILDAEFGLNEKGLTSLVLVSFGYSSSADFNAGLPKSRLTQEATFTFID